MSILFVASGDGTAHVWKTTVTALGKQVQHYNLCLLVHVQCTSTMLMYHETLYMHTPL